MYDMQYTCTYIYDMQYTYTCMYDMQAVPCDSLQESKQVPSYRHYICELHNIYTGQYYYIIMLGANLKPQAQKRRRERYGQGRGGQEGRTFVLSREIQKSVSC